MSQNELASAVRFSRDGADEIQRDSDANITLVVQDRACVELDGVSASRYVPADRVGRLRLGQQFR